MCKCSVNGDSQLAKKNVECFVWCWYFCKIKSTITTTTTIVLSQSLNYCFFAIRFELWENVIVGQSVLCAANIQLRAMTFFFFFSPSNHNVASGNYYSVFRSSSSNSNRQVFTHTIRIATMLLLVATTSFIAPYNLNG